MGIPLRLGFYYAAIFMISGAAAPYMPVWFAHKGLSGAQIGLILAAPLLARGLTAPLLAMWADSFRLRRTPLMLLAGATAATYVALAAPMGFAGWFLIWFLASSAYSTLSPLTDVIVLRRARVDGFNYGFPRGLGSAGFILANLVVGVLLASGSPDRVLMWMIVSVLVLIVVTPLLLPPDPVREEGGVAALSERMAGLGGLVRDPAFMLVVLAAGLVQASHTFYYSFSALVWKQQGISETLTGVLWAVGVGVEVAFMWFMEPWRRRIGSRMLLAIGAGAAIIRWIVVAFAPPLWLLFPLQALHTLSFAATFLASLQLVERLSTPGNASAAQAINSALSGGVLGGVATIGAGALYDRFGPGGYLVMAGLAGLGLVGALCLYGVRRLDG